MSVSRVVIPVLENLEQNEKPLVKQVVKGIKQIQEQQIDNQTNTTNQTTFQFQPPSQNTVIDRCFVLEHQFTAELASTANQSRFVIADGEAGGNIGALADAKGNAAGSENMTSTIGFPNISGLVPVVGDTTAVGNTQVTDSALIRWGNTFAPRQFPLANCMDSIDLVINGTHFSVSPNQYIQAVMKYTTPEWRQTNLGYTFHAPDTDSLYEHTVGYANHPLGTSKDAFSRGQERPRGQCFVSTGLNTGLVAVVNGTDGNTANCGLQFTFREPLFISPLMAMLGHGLTNVNQINITIRWAANLNSRLFSLVNLRNSIQGNATAPDAVAAGGSNNALLREDDFNAPTTGTSRLHIRYYTAQDDVNIPNEIVLPYKQPQVEREVITNGNSMTSKNIRLNQIPESVYVFIRKRTTYTEPNGAEMRTCDNYGIITGVNVNWKNQIGILSGFTQSDIDQLSRYNGFDSDSMRGRVGTVLKLNYGQDIPLDDNESPGTRGDYNWQIKLDYNLSSLVSSGGGLIGNNDLELVQVFVLNGHAIVSPNECRVATGVLALEDNMRADEMGHSYQAYGAELAGGSMVGGSEVGGSLIGGVAGHLRKVYNVGKHMVQAGQAAAPELKEAVKAYQSRA